jgi:hypothetical protein
MKTRTKPSTCANPAGLTLTVAETTIEIFRNYWGDKGATISQCFTGPQGIEVTRSLDYYNAQDRAVLKLEARKLGIRLSNEGDLHRFATKSIGPVILTVTNGRAGRKMVVMESIEGRLTHADLPSVTAKGRHGVTFEDQALPHGMVRAFYLYTTTVTFSYKGGLLQGATISQAWTDGDTGENDFTRVMRWDDISDMRLLRFETGLPLEHATDLVETNDQYANSSHVLCAHDGNNDPTIVVLDGVLAGLDLDASTDGRPSVQLGRACIGAEK